MHVRDASDERRIATIEGEILTQADSRASEMLQKAERVAQRIVKSAERKAEELRREAERAIVPRRQAERARAFALVELDVRREEAARREALVEEVFAEARAILSRWRERPDAETILARFVSEAVPALPGSRFRVELAPEDASRFGRDLLERLGRELSSNLGRPVALELAASSDGFSGGVRVMSEDGRTMVDQTFEARLAALAGEFRKEIVRTVFASGTADREGPAR